MLVLSRKCNESIVIGDKIRIKVVGISGNQVRLGIEAPSEVSIMREELLVEHEAPRSKQSATTQAMA
jgi:carbon storage regulator